MARGKRMTVGSKYVSIGALAEVILAVNQDLELPGDATDKQAAFAVAEAIVERAWDVEHFPTAGRVQITLDLGRLDQPAD